MSGLRVLRRTVTIGRLSVSLRMPGVPRRNWSQRSPTTYYVDSTANCPGSERRRPMVQFQRRRLQDLPAGRPNPSQAWDTFTSGMTLSDQVHPPAT